jgi:hypothetical protein
MHNALSRRAGSLAEWLTPSRKRAAIGVLVLLALLIVAAIFRLRS